MATRTNRRSSRSPKSKPRLSNIVGWVVAVLIGGSLIVGALVSASPGSVYYWNLGSSVQTNHNFAGGFEIISPALNVGIGVIGHPLNQTNPDKLVVPVNADQVTIQVKFKPAYSALYPGWYRSDGGHLVRKNQFESFDIGNTPLALYAFYQGVCELGSGAVRRNVEYSSPTSGYATLTLIRRIDNYTADFRLNLNSSFKQHWGSPSSGDSPTTPYPKWQIALAGLNSPTILSRVTAQGGSVSRTILPGWVDRGRCNASLSGNTQQWGSYGPTKPFMLVDQAATNRIKAELIPSNSGKSTPAAPSGGNSSTPPASLRPVIEKVTASSYLISITGTNLVVNGKLPSLAPEPGSSVVITYKNGTTQRFTDQQFLGNPTSISIYVSNVNQTKNIQAVIVNTPRGNAFKRL